MIHKTLITLCVATCGAAALVACAMTDDGAASSAGEAIKLPPIKPLPIGRGAVKFDPTSDAELAELSPVLATGSFVYTLKTMSTGASTLTADGTATLGIVVEEGGRLRIDLNGRKATSDTRGHFVSSPDPTVSPLATVPVQLPPGTAALGATWTQDGLPYTTADLANANAAGATAESSAFVSQALGVLTISPSAKLLVLKRTSFAYVLPTSATAETASVLEPAGDRDFSAGMRGQSGTIYDYWVVSTATNRAAKIAETAVRFNRFERPATAASIFAGTFGGPYVVTQSSINVASSVLPVDLAAAITAGLGLLPATPALWFDESVTNGALLAAVATSCTE